MGLMTPSPKGTSFHNVRDNVHGLHESGHGGDTKSLWEFVFPCYRPTIQASQGYSIFIHTPHSHSHQYYCRKFSRDQKIPCIPSKTTLKHPLIVFWEGVVGCAQVVHKMGSSKNKPHFENTIPPVPCTPSPDGCRTCCGLIFV